MAWDQNPPQWSHLREGTEAYSANATVTQYEQYVESATPNILLYDRQYESHMAKNAGTWPRKPENLPPQSYSAT